MTLYNGSSHQDENLTRGGSNCLANPLFQLYLDTWFCIHDFEQCGPTGILEPQTYDVPRFAI